MSDVLKIRSRLFPAITNTLFAILMWAFVIFGNFLEEPWGYTFESEFLIFIISVLIYCGIFGILIYYSYRILIRYLFVIFPSFIKAQDDGLLIYHYRFGLKPKFIAWSDFKFCLVLEYALLDFHNILQIIIKRDEKLEIINIPIYHLSINDKTINKNDHYHYLCQLCQYINEKLFDTDDFLNDFDKSKKVKDYFNNWILRQEIGIRIAFILILAGFIFFIATTCLIMTLQDIQKSPLNEIAGMICFVSILFLLGLIILNITRNRWHGYFLSKFSPNRIISHQQGLIFCGYGMPTSTAKFVPWKNIYDVEGMYKYDKDNNNASGKIIISILLNKKANFLISIHFSIDELSNQNTEYIYKNLMMEIRQRIRNTHQNNMKYIHIKSFDKIIVQYHGDLQANYSFLPSIERCEIDNILH